MAKRAGRDCKVGINKNNIDDDNYSKKNSSSNNINNQQPADKVDTVDNPLLRQKNSKTHTKLIKKSPFLIKGVSSDLFTDAGHRGGLSMFYNSKQLFNF
jgi:hypothetical protein